MPPNIVKLYTIFKQAVESERQAQAMYQEAMGVCQDEATKAAMQILYEDEVRHEKEIIERYNDLRRRFDVPAE
jgi:rubrerythrin